jgi:hypothetical protein
MVHGSRTIFERSRNWVVSAREARSVLGAHHRTDSQLAHHAYDFDGHIRTSGPVTHVLRDGFFAAVDSSSDRDLRHCAHSTGRRTTTPRPRRNELAAISLPRRRPLLVHEHSTAGSCETRQFQGSTHRHCERITKFGRTSRYVATVRNGVRTAATWRLS